MWDKKTVILTIVALVLYGLLIALIIKGNTAAVINAGKDPAFHLEYANTLKVKELYRESITEYERYMSEADIPASKQANITYQIGNLYLDEIHDYEKALAAYLKVELLDPQGSLVKEARKHQVECLERMGRSRDAQEKLDQITSLKQKPEKGETVIAQVGDRVITDRDLRNRLDQLPAYAREQYQTHEQQVEFLKEYIAAELMFDTAIRKGLDRKPEIEKQVFEMKKALLVQNLIEDEIKSQVTIEDSDLDLYFQAHKDKYSTEGEPLFEDVREQVIRDVTLMKQRELYRKLIDRMISAENVRIFDDKVGGTE